MPVGKRKIKKKATRPAKKTPGYGAGAHKLGSIKKAIYKAGAKKKKKKK